MEPYLCGSDLDELPVVVIFLILRHYLLRGLFVKVGRGMDSWRMVLNDG